jgi:hypothetical protein
MPGTISSTVRNPASSQGSGYLEAAVIRNLTLEELAP